METQRGVLMTKFKMGTIGVVALISLFAIMSWFYGNKMDDLKTSLRKEREEHSTIVSVKDEEIGDYSYRLGVLESDLEDAHVITDAQKDFIDKLQDELDAKVTEINNITVAIDSVQSEGNAEVILVSNGSVVYTINEHKQGYHLTATVVHPSGDYAYTIRQDPLTMELYMFKEKGTGYKIGSIKFPNNPGVVVTKWQLLYDPDTRAWYEKMWENTHFDVGVFGGSNAGISAMLGYKKVMVGPVFTEDGMNFGGVYRLK